MIGLVEHIDTRQRLVDRDAPCIDLLRLADHPRNGAETAGHPHGPGIGEGRQPPVEHARIELVGLAVHIHEGSREMRAQQRHAALHHPLEQRIDVRVLGATQRRQVEPYLIEELRRVDPARMRRVEHHGRQRLGRLQRLEGGVEIADLGFAHQLSGKACDRDSLTARRPL